MQVDGSFSGVAMAAAFTPTKPETLAQNREIIQAVREVNASGMVGERNMLTFAMDRETRKPVMRIVDRKTNEVVTQIPAEQVLRMARQLRAAEG